MVAGIPLLDTVGKLPSSYDGDSPAELQARMANELVAACLDEHRHIEALDVCGPTKKWRRLYVRETEAQMRQMHEAWIAIAHPLLARVGAMKRAGFAIERLDELEEAVLMTRGLLKMSVDDIERGMEQIRQGHYVTLEEARRGLRAKRGA
jgi:hypothetical protein